MLLRSERPSTLVTMMTLGGRGGSLQLVEGLEEAVEDEVEAGRVAVVSREDVAAEAAVGGEAGLLKVPVEAVDEADVSREAGPAGAVNTSSSKSAEVISSPVDELTEAACESGAGSSNRDFMSIVLQSDGRSSLLLLSKIMIFSPPIL